MSGFILEKSGCTGVMPWAYMSSSRDPYNDFDGKDMCIAYPSKEEPIPTLAWEAIREGVDDVRYLTTLKELIKKQKDTRKVQRAKKVISEIMDKISLNVSESLFDLTDKDLQDLRWRIAQEIMRLRR